MKRIALISCTSSKKDYPCKASELYSASPRFRFAYRYAKNVADEVYILSAKHGLLGEDMVLAPYDESLIIKGVSEREEWTGRVLEQLKAIADLKLDHFIMLAGAKYCEFLLPELANYFLPLRGKRQGEGLALLKNMCEQGQAVHIAADIHNLFAEEKRLRWTDIGTIPYSDGIYVVYESGEKYQGMDRIVRIGTHRGDGNLRGRLNQHFINENMDASIFRKNIGRALSGKKDPVAEFESEVTKHLRDNVSFVVFQVTKRNDRLRLEAALIAGLHADPSFGPGDEWLGRKSPIQAIRNSGLWNVQGLTGNPLRSDELDEIRSILRHKQPEQTRQSKVSAMKQVALGQTKTQPSADDVRLYIDEILAQAASEGMAYIELVSGQIHRDLGMSGRLPQVCRIMWEKKRDNDVVVHTTPSGMSSTIAIRYYVY